MKFSYHLKTNVPTLKTIDNLRWTLVYKKKNMIFEIVDCLNVLCENDFTYDENMFLLCNICIT